MSTTELGGYTGAVVDEWGNRAFTLTDEWGNRVLSLVVPPVGLDEYVATGPELAWTMTLIYGRWVIDRPASRWSTAHVPGRWETGGPET